jgi:hypothetical protein
MQLFSTKDRLEKSVKDSGRIVKIKRVCQALAVAGLLASSAPALAHHSTAMFDYSKDVELDAVVKSFQWSNPHNYIQVLVPNDKGGQTEWSIEAGAPEIGKRLGWSRDTIKAGDKVKLVIAPLKNGNPGEGTLKSCTLPDGRMLYGPGHRVGPATQGPGTSALPSLDRATQ